MKPLDKYKTMQSKILIVLTSHGTLGNTGKETGFYLSEVTHPYYTFVKAGFAIDFVSPGGGKAPMDGVDTQDAIDKIFLDDSEKMAQIENTFKPSQINPKDYDAIFYAGGHGVMWDLPDDRQLAEIAAAIYQQGGVVGAVCHGAAGLVNIKLSNGEYLLNRKTVSCFTNEEETAVELTNVVPFLLESKMIERGAEVEKAKNFQSKVVVSDRLVTGQNPASAAGVGEEIVKAINKNLHKEKIHS